MPNKQKLLELLELANNYPSPHNGQPFVVSKVSGETVTIAFEKSRGLSATPISYLFSFVSIGVFVRHFELCAKALGHEAIVELMLPTQSELAGEGLLPCANFTISFDSTPVDAALQRLITTRQTSRKKYSKGLSVEQIGRLQTEASQHNLSLKVVNQKQAAQVIWLNQKAVFDDMFDDAVRNELNHWLRYNKQQKDSTRDGLAYDCMELNGSMLRFFVKHYRLLRRPVVAPMLRQYYLRTMADSSTVGYIVAPFETEAESYEIGRCVIDCWIAITKEGGYLHPFGTIVSNEQAHADFTKLVGFKEEKYANYVVFIFRAGFSDEPVKSHRIAVSEHLLNKEKPHD